MGKQLKLYLNDEQIRKLNEVANRQCRRTQDQALYILLSSLGLTEEPVASTQTLTGATAEVSAKQTV